MGFLQVCCGPTYRISTSLYAHLIHPDTLKHSFASVSVAFIEITDWNDRMAAAGDNSAALLSQFSWLNHVYVAFDALVDKFGDSICKIEEVR